MTYSIRPIEKQDLPQVTEIDREVFPTQWPPANYRQELHNRLAHYIVVYDDTRTTVEMVGKPGKHLLQMISGILLPWTRPPYPPADTDSTVVRQYIVGFSGIWLLADEAHITNIAVRQQYQGRGIGELLLIATIDLAIKLRANIMTLEVRDSNQVALNLYNKYGFTQTGRRRGYYLDNREDAIVMSTVSITSNSFQARLWELRESLAKRMN